MAKKKAPTTRTPRKAAVSNKRSIPKTANVPSEKLNDYSIVLYGEKGVGKTSLAAQFPNSLVFMWEPGRRNLKIKQVPQKGEGELTWESFLEYIDLAVDDKSIGTIIIDTVDRCYEACFRYICSNKGIDHPNQLNDYGKTWGEIKREFESTFNALIFTDMVPIFISHSRMRPAPGRRTEEEAPDMVQPTCSPACWEYIRSVTDLAMYYGYQEYERILYIRGHEFVWSACGMDTHFLDPKTKKPLDILPVGVTAKAAYSNLCLAWNNKLEGYFCNDNEE